MTNLTTRKRLILVIISVILLSIGWLGLSGITLLFALVPLMIISEHYSDSRRDFMRMMGWAAMTFLLWSIMTIWWVAIAHWSGPVTAGIVGTFWNLVAFMTYHYVSKRAPRALAYTLLATLWIATEYFYYSADVMTFPWLLLGHGFSNDIWAVQWYEYTGVFGGTLWAIASNISIFEAMRSNTKVAKVRATIISIAPILISIAIYFMYNPSEERAMLSVVQPNVACYEDKKISKEDIAELVAELPDDTSCAILPESALCYVEEVPTPMDEKHIDGYANAMKGLFGGRDDISMIVGQSTVRLYGDNKATSTARKSEVGYIDYFNTAIHVDHNGAVKDIYHKAKLVIGVEAMPEFVSSFVDLGGVSGQLGWGKEHDVFSVDSMKIGPAICYEALYSDYFAGFVRKGANVMAVISNDGWWGDTPGHKRLFDFCRLRAIETRRSIARSANTGISGFISPRGDVVGDLLEWDERGTLTESVELRDDITMYVRYGDWIARISIFAAVLSLLYYVAYRVRRRNHLVD
ncbi:MAG: apolipoprotein N-acyltransferase [Rikenellaceae bacterium]|nr:apolipoprotein N-acyltransferase [Rikenellaceae bacterium]